MGTPLLQTAGGIEWGAGGLIVLGLSTRYAPFLASGEMAAAYFTVHIWNGFWPLGNRGELAMLCCFLFIASRGASPVSRDRVRG